MKFLPLIGFLLLTPLVAADAATTIITPMTSNSVQLAPGNPPGTANTTLTMMGLAGTFTPQFSGNVTITAVGTLANNTGGDGYTYSIRYGTGSAPSNGAASTGTQCGQAPQINSTATAGEKKPFAIVCNVIGGMAVGTTYWYDMAIAAITGGTVTAVLVTMTATEN